jgi:hypothetical protein
MGYLRISKDTFLGRNPKWKGQEKVEKVARISYDILLVYGRHGNLLGQVQDGGSILAGRHGAAMTESLCNARAGYDSGAMLSEKLS